MTVGTIVGWLMVVGVLVVGAVLVSGTMDLTLQMLGLEGQPSIHAPLPEPNTH